MEDGRLESAILKFEERPMILRKLNQIRPDQTGAFTIPVSRFTSRGGVWSEHGYSHARVAEAARGLGRDL